MVKLDWNSIQKSNDLILKTNEPIRIKFLDNECSVDDYEIIDKKTNEKKIVDKFTFQVLDLDTNKEKEFSTLANPLMVLIKEFIPLKNKSITINKFKTGYTDFDIDYEVKLIE